MSRIADRPRLISHRPRLSPHRPRRIALAVAAALSLGFGVTQAAAAATGTSAAAAATGTSAAAAATGPSQGSLTSVEVTDNTVTAVLNLPGGQTQATLAAGSLTATIGGKPAKVTLTPVRQEQRSALVVIDTSGSMGAAGIAAATQAAAGYVAKVPADVRVGLVTFADAPRLVVPLTADRAAVRNGLAALKAQGETTLYDGVQLALRTLGTAGTRDIVVLSDGSDSSSSSSLAVLLSGIKASGVHVEAVGFNTDAKQNAVLSSIATAGHGRLIAASGAPALGAAFSQAAQTLAGQVRLTIVPSPDVDGDQPMVVTALAGGQPVAAGASVSVTGHPADAAGSSASTAPLATSVSVPSGIGAVLASRTTLWFALAALFFGVLVVCLHLASPLFVSASRRRLQTLGDYLGDGASSARRVAANTSAGAVTTQVLQLSDKLTKDRAATRQSALLLERADLPLRVNEWYVLRAVSVAVAVAGGWVLMRGSFWTALLGVVLGFGVGLVLPSVLLRFAASRRAGKFESQLPDVLTLMASSLSTGFSLPQAIDAIVRDAAEPSAKEFSRALAETRIGADLEDSLDRVSRRMNSRNLEWTTMAIRIQRQVGGSLAETLRTTATTLRERESLGRHVKALSAEGRLSAAILIVLPIGLFVYMLVVNKEYLSLLWTDVIGWFMSAGAVFGIVVGVFWMRKVVKVEV